MSVSATPPVVSRLSSTLRWPIVALIRLYRHIISPLLPPGCRFWPSCSRYAEQAVVRYGALRGGWVALQRLGRCHPFNKGGYDPLQ